MSGQHQIRCRRDAEEPLIDSEKRAAQPVNATPMAETQAEVSALLQLG